MRLVAWPLSSHARSNRRWLLSASLPRVPPRSDAYRVIAFRQGLKKSGYVDGHNFGRIPLGGRPVDQLPAMAADLVHRQVAVIAATSAPAAVAAKAATATIPIIFETGCDPVQLGLVASLNRPGRQRHGRHSNRPEVTPKRLELVHELLPTAASWLSSSTRTFPPLRRPQAREAQSAAHTLGLELHVLNARSEP